MFDLLRDSVNCIGEYSRPWNVVSYFSLIMIFHSHIIQHHLCYAAGGKLQLLGPWPPGLDGFLSAIFRRRANRIPPANLDYSLVSAILSL